MGNIFKTLDYLLLFPEVGEGVQHGRDDAVSPGEKKK